jgi:hypothetical protein
LYRRHFSRETKALIEGGRQGETIAGFLLSVWIFGKSANAGMNLTNRDLSASSRPDGTSSIDNARFTRTGEIVRNNGKRANLFAYACLGHINESGGGGAAGTAPGACGHGSTYFYECG